jgi:hypothetical protein
VAGTPSISTVTPDAARDSAWPARRAAALLIAGGTAAAVLGSLRSDLSSSVIVLIGASLAAAGRISRVHQWMTAIGLPVLGFAVGVELSAVAVPLVGYRTTAALAGVGLALLAPAMISACGITALAPASGGGSEAHLGITGTNLCTG